MTLRALGALLLLVLQVRSLSASDPNEQCLMCHEDQSLKNEAGHSLFVNKGGFEQSIHGKKYTSPPGLLFQPWQRRARSRRTSSVLVHGSSHN